MPEQAGLMTVGELAARVRPLARDPFALTARARHWGRLGLLVAADNVGEGTGKHKLYPQDAAYDLAVLNALADAGQEPGKHRWLADAQSLARIAFARWKQTRGRQPMILEISFFPGGRLDLEVHKGTAAKTKARATVSIRVNLGAVFEGVASPETIMTADQQWRLIDEERRAAASKAAKAKHK